jgi:hypothetical protein
VIAGRYELEREVGRGGMGAVWLAQDTVLGRQVAIKRVGMVPGGATPDFERAEREARLAARLNHAHVVAVFDLVTDPEGLWLVMEYVEGSTLAGLVSAEGALSQARATALLVQAADALTAAHEAGIVHRDVKPSNILVSAEDRVKLSDFGIARAEADSSLTQTGLVTGSPAYLAPEVASGQSATDASDVWSLGATLFHALSGRPPYEVGDNLMGTLYKIVHEEPPRLADAGWLAPLLEATMTRDPADRWSMAQVRDYLAAGPEGARPPAPVPAAVPEPTQMMAPVAATEPVTEPVAAPAPEPAGRTTTTESPESPVETPTRRRTPWVLIGVGLVLLVVLLVVAWSLVTGGDDPPAAEGPGASDSPSDTGGTGTGTGDGGSESEETTPPEEPTQEGMETFIADYLATASSDPSASYERLTPAFQRASGGAGGYTGFWNTIDTAELVDVTADPESLTVSYTWAYTRTDGSSGTDDVTLGLVFRDGQYLIAEES